MPSLYLVANSVFFTSYGHIQVVYDADGQFGNGDEAEIEVQPSGLLSGDWDVSPVQPHEVPFGVADQAIELTVPAGRDVADVWALLVNARNYFAGLTIDYRLGLSSAVDGQNSNSYVTTLAHIAGLDIAPAIAGFLASASFGTFPGIARNVVFDHVDSDGNQLAPLALTLAGTGGFDFIAGGSGADTLSGASGKDTLLGHGADDTLNGGNGHDTLRGGDGNDTLNGNRGRDLIEGDAGDDLLFGQAQDDRLFGGAGMDAARGGNGADRLFGNGGHDRLWGGRDDDALFGGYGRDQLWGQHGEDLLNGMQGDDVMTGGGGADIFVFVGTRDEGHDEITDFTPGTDLIRVEGLTFADVLISGDDTALISLDGKTEISLTGVAASDVTAGDFDFLIA